VETTTGAGSRWNALARVLRAGLLHRRLPVALALLAALLALPSLWVGWVADDYYHQLRLVETPAFAELSGSPMDMFTFADGDPEHVAPLMDIGFWPWWTLPEIKGAFFRPITVITHWLDYQLWPDRPALMHAQSILWFAGLIVVTTILYRRLIGLTWVAGLAALLYAIDDARGMPVGFLANRNALIAAFFGVLAIIAHHRWRSRNAGPWRAGAVVTPLLLAASLLSAEAGIGTIAYLFAHALFLDRGSWRQRLVVLLPYGVVVVIWRIVWSGLGYGVWGMDLYVDPVTEPLHYLAGVLVRAPILLLGQLLLPPSEAYLLCLDQGFDHLYFIVALPILVAVGVLVIPRLRWDAMTRFWALGMLLSLLPICTTFPADRMLFFVGLGAFALLAQFLSVVFGQASAAVTFGPRFVRRLPARILAVVFVLVHACLAPVVLAVRCAMPIGPRSLVDGLQIRLPKEAELEGQTIVAVTAPLGFGIGYLPIKRALEGLSVPAHTWALAPYDRDFVAVRRTDEQTLVIRPKNGYLVLAGDRLPRGLQHPMSVGERVELTGMTAEVLALTEDGRPAEVAFRFSVPLEDPSLRFLRWESFAFIPFALPEVGETVELR
jgi:hypothetical protein